MKRKPEEKTAETIESIQERKEKLYESAVDKWGVTSQVALLLEELAELQASVAKVRLSGPGNPPARGP